MGGVGEKIVLSAVTGVMSPVLGKLTSLIEKKYTEIKGVRRKLEQLRKELMAINLALEKHAAMESPDAQAKAWAAEMRELAYDMEDSIDLFTHHVDHEPSDTTTGVKRFFSKKIQKLKKLHHRHKFAKEIQDLHDLVNEAYERRKRHQIEESSTSHMEIDPRLHALYVEVEKLVGIKRPMNDIIGRLIRENPVERRVVVSIVGSGGLGKTTLAKQVYEEIKAEFSYHAFVSVSQNPNMNNLLRGLLSEIERQGGGSRLMAVEPYWSDQQLIDHIRSCLENERYLFVIDDVWTTLSWETIQCALPKNANASRIIITTRINSVGLFCCTSDQGFVYQMKPLGRSSSEKLFLKRIFCAGDRFPVHLKRIKDQILKKCDGLPLAIVTLASLLATKPREKKEWGRALDSIRSMHEKDSGLEVMDKILSLSYNDLPHHMINCLLYLSTFPEDHKIYKNILIWRWIAEGFITEKQGFTSEQVAESYFYELVNRNLIQPITFDVTRHGMPGQEEGCQVHDIVLNFLISRSAEENFLTILDGQGVPLPPSDRRIRRLSIWDNVEHAREISQGTMNLSHLRSISICNVRGWAMPPVLDLPVLRVLNLEGCHALDIVDPDCISSLFSLRYLEFRGASCVTLPAQIGNLQYLQTLNLSRTGVTQLPKSIVQLKQLRYLVGEELVMPDGFGSMESLQELGSLDGCRSSINFAEDLALLSKLRVLHVTLFGFGTESVRETRHQSLMSSLRKLIEGNSLRNVYIDGYGGGGDHFIDSWCPPPLLLQRLRYTGTYFPSIPKWMNSCLCDLTYLGICLQTIERDHLRILGVLPAIRFLYLTVRQVPQDGLIISHGAFRCLIQFEFYNIDGPGLVFEGGMRMLEWLRLGFDAGKAQSTYGSLGIGIRHLSSLKHIYCIVRMISEGENDPAKEAIKSAINGQVKMLHSCPAAGIVFTDGP